MRVDLRALPCAVALVFALSAGTSASQAQEPIRQSQPGRDSLERQVQRRVAQMMKTHLELTDEQMLRLRATNRRFEGQRRILFEREREVRTGLRREMRREMHASDSTRNEQISALLDRMLLLQRQRLDLLEAEQKDLANFLSPMQRARYFGMEEQIRRRINEMRERGRDDRGGPGRPDGPRQPDGREHGE